MSIDRKRELSPAERGREHSKYVELCALFTTGSLEPNELEDLDLHLAICKECRTTLAGYYRVVRGGFSLLATDRQMEESSSFHWNQSKAKKQLFATLEVQGREGADQSLEPVQVPPAVLLGPLAKHYLLLGVLCVSMGAAGYWIGSRQHQGISQPQSAQASSEPSLVAQFAGVTKQRDQLEAKITERDKLIGALSAEVAKQTDEVFLLERAINESKEEKSEQAKSLAALRQENISAVTDREAMVQKLQEAQSSLAELRENLSRLQSERIADLLQTASMQKKIEDLTNEIDAHKSMVAEQQKLLASDPDIRELMGARDLHMADVFDIDSNGQTQRAFGRVFYTKNKPLIFYAFDLDKQPNLRNARTFQAWGERSTDKQRPVNLGIFHVDNEANRRWRLKFDDPRVIEQINAVFVTVEPSGGSEKPSGKQLLYACLPTQPNHP